MDPIRGSSIQALGEFEPQSEVGHKTAPAPYASSPARNVLHSYKVSAPGLFQVSTEHSWGLRVPPRNDGATAVELPVARLCAHLNIEDRLRLPNKRQV